MVLENLGSQSQGGLQSVFCMYIFAGGFSRIGKWYIGKKENAFSPAPTLLSYLLSIFKKKCNKQVAGGN